MKMPVSTSSLRGDREGSRDTSRSLTRTRPGSGPGHSPAGRAGRDLVCAVLLLLPWAAAAALETPTEFHASGDFDGDTRTDLVIVERSTGIYRVALQTSPGSYSWTEARASGVPGVAAVSVGRVLATTRDALVLTSPEANRVNVLDLSSPALPSIPVAWHSPGIGPRTVVALDIGGAGNTAHDDLYVVTALNGAPAPIQQALGRSTGSALTALGPAAATVDVQRGDRVQLSAGGPVRLALVVRAGGGTDLRVFSTATGSLVPVATAAGIPEGARFVAHRFGAGVWHQFLFHTPGSPRLQLRQVQELVPGTFSFAAAVDFDLGKAIAAVQVLPGPGSARLLVLHQDGAEAAIYDFDGIAAPALVQSFAAPAGSQFTGAAALGDLQTLLFSGGSGTGRSTGYAMKKWDGATYVEGPSGALPDGSPYAAPANVFLFQSEPFVTPSPVLVQRLAAGDWTSQPILAGVPLRISVTVESYGGSSSGLGSPLPRTLAEATPPAAFALANQYLPSISVFSLYPPIGDENVEVRIQPAAGAQTTAIQVSLTASVPGAVVRYRVDDGGTWTTYTSPFAVFRDTTVQYFAQLPASDRKSVIHRATYTFAGDASERDSDNDGVPDFAELGLDANNNGTPDYAELGEGLDPVVAGKDADGDGFADLDEWIAGTNPYSDASTPAAGSRLEDRSGFDLFLTPRPWDGTVSVPSTALAGANLRLHAVTGTLLQFSRATNLAAPAPPSVPTALMTNVVVDTRQRLLAVATESHFAIATASSDKLLGRELVGLLPVPDLAAGVPVSYSLGGGTLAAEAAAWRAAAQAAAGLQPRVEWVRDLTPEDTLTAALVERRLELLLHERGLDPTNRLSLFSFRAGDVDRRAPTLTELVGLEQEAGGLSAYRVVDLHAGISNAVALADSANGQRLRDLNLEIVRISSAFNNVSPGAYPLPLEVLREFFRSGTLHSNYLAATSLDAAAIAAAAAGVGEMLAVPMPRPKATLELTAQPGGVTGECTTLYLGADPRSLVFADGSAYFFPESFELVPGTVVEVTGYTDLPAGACPGGVIEVISARVTAVPAVPTVDTDGDLLPDSYECAFFGSLAADPFEDLDLDGYSNLQEFLDGTDPGDALARGAAPAALLPPVILVSLKPNGSLGLRWGFPSAYADRFHFGVTTAAKLRDTFVDLPALVVPAGADTFEVQLPPPAGATQFYRLRLGLR